MKVELSQATHIVFTDYGPDNDATGFSNIEDAQAYLDNIHTLNRFSGEFDHYMVKVVKRRTVIHDD